MSRLFVVLAWLVLVFLPRSKASAQPVDSPATMPQVVKRAEINPDVPVFVPVHPRIATTITFPKPIGEPVGTGFIDSDMLQKAAAEGKTTRGEYSITYQQGDPFFTVQPLPKSDLLNLNVPYEGVTIVLYFYTVEKPLAAVASLTFVEKSLHPAPTGKVSARPNDVGSEAQRIQRMDAPVANSQTVVTPARLDGFLRKLKLVHAAHIGSELDDVAAAMNLKITLTSLEDPAAKDITQPINHAALFDLILLRAVRDPALDAIGFIVLFRNTSDQELVFDHRTLSARCGAALYTAQVVDAPAQLAPREMRAGYFIMVGAGDGRPGHLLPNNDWKLSVALVAPQVPLGHRLGAAQPHDS